jgi:hypothetical protein
LQAIGGGDGVVVADSLIIDQKGPIVMLGAHNKAAFHYARKNENGLCLFAHELRYWVARVKSIKGGLCPRSISAALAARLEQGCELRAPSARITAVNKLACFMEVTAFCLGRWVR